MMVSLDHSVLMSHLRDMNQLKNNAKVRIFFENMLYNIYFFAKNSIFLI
jgi:hypothetical protein